METKNVRHSELVSESSALSVKIGRSRNKFGMTNFHGFTLVELIVVITILVILGTIAFMNIGGYSSSARDSTRIENLANLKKGLDVYQAKNGVYPLPEGPLNILASGSIIGYQGFAKDQVAGLANLSAGGTKDPSDASIYTTYSVSANQSKMEVMAFLENGSTVTAFLPPWERGVGGIFPVASASSTSDYSQRTPTVKGDTIGILISTATGNLNQPLQEAISATFTGIDIVTFTGNLSDGTPVSLKAQLSNAESIAGTGGELMVLESNINTKMRLVMYACPSGWKDLGSTALFGRRVDCTNDGTSWSNCRICETSNNNILPTNSIILTNSGTCNGPSLQNTGWFQTGAPSSSCDPGYWLCYMCKSVVDSPIPTGTLVLMQSCPYSWKDMWGTATGGNGADCLYEKSCRVCKKQ